MDNQPRDTKSKGAKAEVFGRLHDIKSSLQSLMVANEMVMEAWESKQGSGQPVDSAQALLKKMMEEIEKIHRAANEIEQACERGNYDS